MVFMDVHAELIAYLPTIPIFGGLDAKTLTRIVGMLRCEQLPEHAVIVREGDTGTAMYIVRSGRVALYQQSTTETPVLIARLGPGECFGEMTIIDVQPRSATVVAEQPSVLYSLTNRDLYTLYVEDMPGYVMLIQNLCRELSRRLRKANTRVAQLVANGVDRQAPDADRRPPADPDGGRLFDEDLATPDCPLLADSQVAHSDCRQLADTRPSDADSRVAAKAERRQLATTIPLAAKRLIR
jgi:CRP/FNR family transcriptional regulator, cyclic AMP receptor protein